MSLLPVKICMNELCGVTTTAQWKRGWPMKVGGVATLCYACGYGSSIDNGNSRSDIDLSWSFASQPKSRSTNNGNSRVAFFQRPTALSHQRLTRSMSQAPQMRLHDNYLSDIDLSWGSARQAKSTSVNSDNSRVPSFQRPTASSHRRLTRSMSQAPQMRRSHDDYVVRRVPTSTYLQPE